MARFVVLLRAVNVGGTGKLPMAELTEMCVALGYTGVRTLIASGNVVLDAAADDTVADGAAAVRAALGAALTAYAGRPVGVLVRTPAEIAGVVAANPFAAHPGNRVAALFVDEPLPADALTRATGVNGEILRRGERVVYIHYPDGMAQSRLRIPAAAGGTARNMNTVVRLAAMAAAD